MSEDDVKQTVINSFDKYDKNGDGTLDISELT